MKTLYTLFTLLVLLFTSSTVTLANNGLSFIPNQGQIADLDGQPMNDILFVSYQGEAALYFYKDKIAFCTREYSEVRTPESEQLRAEGNLAEALEKEVRTRDYRFDIVFNNAAPNATIQGEQAKVNHYNFYYAHCPNGITNVPDYSSIRYKNIYPNIDLVFYQGSGGMKYDFIVHPGGNPADIQMEFVGATNLQLSNGELAVNTPFLSYVDQQPFSYQGEGQNPVNSAFTLQNNTLGFQIGNYDNNKDLIIDPTMYWGTYFLARSTVWGNMAVLSDGSFFQSAYQYNQTAPYFDAGTYFDNTHQGSNTDLLFVKFSIDGVQQWTTLYGGTGYEYLINNTTTVDASDNLYFGGVANSADFPMQNAGGYFDNSRGGGNDAFILKFSSSGARIWATYFGGSSGERIRAMQCHPTTNKLYVVGETYSSDFPIQSLSGAYNDNTQNGSQDIFIARFSTTTNLEWSTFFGGSSSEHAHHVDFDAANNMFIVGEHSGWSSPTTAPPLVNPGGGAYFDNTTNGKQDLYINKFNSSRQHVWGTYYGGSFNDNYNGDCSGMSISSNNHIFICGKTASGNFPITSKSGAYNDATHNGTPDSDNDGYIVEFNNSGVIQWSTYYGGSGNEELRNLDHGGTDNLLVGGFSTSANFPILSHTGSYNQSHAGGSDAVILWFDATGARQWATYYGTSGSEDIRPFGVSTASCSPFSILASAGGMLAGYGLTTVDPGGGAFYDDGGVPLSFTTRPWFARFDECLSLPVEITEFNAKAVASTVLTSWQTASETNNKGFVVQRSTNGLEWEDLGFVHGQGNSTTLTDYNFRDENPLMGYSYYRLKQVDLDEQVDYSNSVAVYFEQKNDELVSIYPNPASNELFIKSAVHIQQIKIFDLLGKEVRSINNFNNNSISVEELDQGFYSISIQFKHKTVTQMITISK